MSQVAFPINTFTDAEGAPLSLGYLLIQISEDAFPGTGSSAAVCGAVVFKIPLDSEGVITGSQTFYPNAQLTPSDTYYTLRAYSAEGELVLGPMYIIVIDASGGFGVAFGLYFGS